MGKDSARRRVKTLQAFGITAGIYKYTWTVIAGELIVHSGWELQACRGANLDLHKNGDGINDIMTEKQISINKQQARYGKGNGDDTI